VWGRNAIGRQAWWCRAAVDLVRGASEIADVHVRVVLGDADVNVGEVLQQCRVCAYGA
jgi:hypothetical protein